MSFFGHSWIGLEFSELNQRVKQKYFLKTGIKSKFLRSLCVEDLFKAFQLTSEFIWMWNLPCEWWCEYHKFCQLYHYLVYWPNYAHFLLLSLLFHIYFLKNDSISLIIWRYETQLCCIHPYRLTEHLQNLVSCETGQPPWIINTIV